MASTGPPVVESAPADEEPALAGHGLSGSSDVSSTPPSDESGGTVPARMAQLVLGPILRHVDATSATIWVETDAPATVEVLGHTTRDVLRRATTTTHW